MVFVNKPYSSLYQSRHFAASNVRAWHHLARILQTKAKPGPSHLESHRHHRAISVSRIHLAKRWDWPIRLGHTGGDRRRSPLRCDLGVTPLLVPTEAREADDATEAGALSRDRRRSCG